jgi:hypothetical protein
MTVLRLLLTQLLKNKVMIAVSTQQEARNKFHLASRWLGLRRADIDQRGRLPLDRCLAALRLSSRVGQARSPIHLLAWEVAMVHKS